MESRGGRAQTAGKRRYRSPRRDANAAQTRRSVLAAASAMFSERGWAGTSMREVARSAGVAVETVYANFGSKQALLKAALDVAVVGDDRPVPLAQRPEFATLGAGKRRERARAAARLVLQIHRQTSALGRVLREAAASDAGLGQELREAEQRRRTNVDQGAALVAGRPVTETERDGLWAVLSMEVYQLLVGTAGWSEEEYEEWLTDTIDRLLPARGEVSR
ncbi:MAG: TetR/AcrR family transcriptional regulator [Acidimicrobiia bacterium]|nr:TetR/AcrR family transcriptional regulator [Acidimicrobiia bacterium]